MNGPLLPFTSTSGCCGAARRTGLSCIMQHFCWLKRRCAGQSRPMRLQRNSRPNSGRDVDRDFAVQHNFPEAVIRYRLFGRNPNRSFAARVLNVLLAGQSKHAATCSRPKSNAKNVAIDPTCSHSKGSNLTPKARLNSELKQ